MASAKKSSISHLQASKAMNNPSKRVKGIEMPEKTQDGKYLVHIEVCKDCKEHQWCTRHEEIRYLQMYEETKNVILQANPQIMVVKNEYVKIPILGAFEVTCMGVLLFSKNRCGSFPSPPILAGLIKNFLNDKLSGKQTKQYDLNSPDSRPSNQNILQLPSISPSSSKRVKSRSPYSRSIKNRSLHYSGQADWIEPFQYLVSSTFARGKRENAQTKILTLPDSLNFATNQSYISQQQNTNRIKLSTYVSKQGRLENSSFYRPIDTQQSYEEAANDPSNIQNSRNKSAIQINEIQNTV